ncbi:phytanoyl-CoA dioxygenase family protein [Streptomyces sp. NPDC096013]|uniref:phytanoyl-CoA dioxygenase family protein n=1 Tax=Streptomyces sp. NPDC096013 TaxID=3366069 RepID=UPI00381F9871
MPRNGFFQHGEQDPESSERLLTFMELRRERTLAAGRPERVPAGEINGNKTLWDRLGEGLPTEQRIHLDTHGYVVVPDVLSSSEVQALLDATHALEDDHRAGRPIPDPCWVESDAHEYFRANNIIHVNPAFFDYVSKPAIVSMADHAIGLRPRLVESEVHIRRQPTVGSDSYDFHRGTWFDGTVVDGWYHYPMIKALTFLTDVGPDDGGTAVVPGSHKFRADSDLQSVVDAALRSPSLIDTVCASAGSTLLFFESLVHSNGVIRSGRERVVVISAYGPMMFQPVSGHEPQGELLSRLPSDYYEFIDGARTYMP